jgi:hypothetical protein
MEKLRYSALSALAFLMLLEQLQPFERAVFLLREVFEYEFAEVATAEDNDRCYPGEKGSCGGPSSFALKFVEPRDDD